MFRDFIRTFLRQQGKRKILSFINIVGLAISLSSITLSLTYIINEYSYDKWNPSINKLYRITRSYWSADGSKSMHLGHISSPFAPHLKNLLPEIEMIGRFAQYETRLSVEGQRKENFLEKRVYMTDTEILKMFNVQLIHGDPNTALNEPNSILLSDEMSEKLFKGQNPVGRRIISKDELTLEVKGVFRTFPGNSHVHPDYLISFSTLNDKSVYGRKNVESNYENDSFGTYFLSNEGLEIPQLEEKLDKYIDETFKGKVPEGYSNASDWTKLHIQQVKDIHLYSNLDSEFEANGNISSVYLIATASLLVLILGVINFINLSVARSSERLREIGVKKIHGASKSGLVVQFLGEAVILTFLCFFFSLGISYGMAQWIAKEIYTSLTFAALLNFQVIFPMMLLTLCIGVLAGVYPALLVNLIKPVLIVKGQFNSVKTKFFLQKALLVGQFVVSISLIILAVHISKQLQYMNDFKLGYQRDQVITFPYNDGLSEHYEAFYQALRSNPQIENVTRSSRIPTDRLIDAMETSFESGGTLVSAKVKIKLVCVDTEFFPTYKIPVSEGRNFSASVPTDLKEGFVLNEEAVKSIGWSSGKEAIGKKVQYGYISGKVIGVVPDFHFESLHQTVSPTIFFVSEYPFYLTTSVTFQGNPSGVIPFIQKIWQEYMPNFPFEYSFLDEKYAEQYKAERIELSVLNYLAVVSIILCGIGLLGLTISSTNQKIKDVSVRKVHGASIQDILFHLLKEPVQFLFIAFLISSIVSWYGLNAWLDSFPYRTPIDFLVFVSAFAGVLILSIVIIVVQTKRVITLNPARSLKHE